MGTANEAGMNENAMLTIIAAEKASKSCIEKKIRSTLILLLQSFALFQFWVLVSDNYFEGYPITFNLSLKTEQ